MRRYLANLWAAICGRYEFPQDAITISVVVDKTQAERALAEIERHIDAAISKADQLAKITDIARVMTEPEGEVAILAEAQAKFIYESPVFGETHEQAHARFAAILRGVRGAATPATE